ncbi:Lipopolysaccharide core heptosyltransferase RfaQ [compost metagenome]
MLASHPALSNIFVIDRQWKKQGTKAHLRHELNLIRQLKGQGYDLVVNLADQWRSAIIARLTGARIRLGFDFPKRRGFLWRHCHTHLVPVSDHARLHTVEQNLSLLQPLGLPSLNQQVTMSYPPQDWQTCEQLLRQRGITGDYIVVQPTSRWFFKCWSEEKMAAAISALQADGHRLVITSGPDTKERQMVERILALCPPQGVVSLAGQLTLRQLAALIDHAKLFIGVDSVPMHMAAALQTPCIALFGPSKLVFWRPWQVNGCVIWAGDFGTLPDPDAINTGTDERYLDLIPTDAVIAAARSRLA